METSAERRHEAAAMAAFNSSALTISAHEPRTIPALSTTKIHGSLSRPQALKSGRPGSDRI